MDQLKGNYNYFFSISLVTFFMVLHTGLALNSKFELREGCICPQAVNDTQNFIYECTIIGSNSSISTTWKGTAFNCPGSGNEIVLRHSQFTAPGGVNVSCNNGNIRGLSVDMEDNQCCTSQLNVTYGPALLGDTIMCVHNTGTSDMDIGESTIGVRTDPFPSPDSITLSNIASEPRLTLTFTWSRVASGCQEVSYTISSDCAPGCPTSTQSTTAVCTDVEVPSTASGRVCTFGVRTDVCGNIIGTPNNSLRVNLKFPDPPTVSVVPTYFQETRDLAAIKAEFMESAAFNITDDVDGSATSYIIEYFDGTVCATETVLPSTSCVDRLCTHFFDISSSRCNRSAPITVAVSGVNSLGRGAASTPSLIREVSNNFVAVTINLMSTAVTCTFLSSQQSNGGLTTKTCSIMYNQSETCEVDDTLRLSQVRQIAQNTSDTVTIGLPYINRLRGGRDSYCFVVNATNGTYTAMIRGTFSTGCDPNRLYDETTTLSPAEGATCDPPLSFIGTSDGYACYSGTLVGAYAVHRCLNCDYRSVRVCMADGNWNGAALQCDQCPITAQTTEISLPISLGVFIPIIVILIALLALFILLYISVIHKKKETSVQILQLQRRVTELSAVYEELDPRASRMILQDSSDSKIMETMDNKAYSVPRKTTPTKVVDPEVPLGEAYEIMRSVKHQ